MKEVPAYEPRLGNMQQGRATPDGVSALLRSCPWSHQDVSSRDVAPGMWLQGCPPFSL
jgi:hypothetical protein